MIDSLVIELLGQSGIPWSGDIEERLQHHVDLVREWNAFASLVSKGDVDRVVQTHVIDSLSLAPFIHGHGCLLDVGSGGGFPAIPVSIVLPDLPVTMVERSERAAGFLKKVTGAVGLRNCDIVQGNFPECVTGHGVGAITARAVERPDRVLRGVCRYMPKGSLFLCQSGDPRGVVPSTFHVEHIDDAWRAKGFRRGELFLVRRTGGETPDGS